MDEEDTATGRSGLFKEMSPRLGTTLAVVQKLLSIIDNVKKSDNGKFFAWDGQQEISRFSLEHTSQRVNAGPFNPLTQPQCLKNYSMTFYRPGPWILHVICTN